VIRIAYNKQILLQANKYLNYKPKEGAQIKDKHKYNNIKHNFVS
jgi:hypothetical protein